MDIIFSTLMLLYHLVTGTGEENAASKQLAASLFNAAAGKTIIQAVPAMTTATPEAFRDGLKADPQPEAPTVKGVYVTAYSAGGSRLNSLLKLMDDTELNSMVIDIKDDNGYITYPTQTPELLKLGTTRKFIPNIQTLMSKLEAHKVYPIARIVVFKDTVLAKKHPEYSYRHADGSLWANGKGDSFVNPYLREVWDYNVAVAKEAVKLGFKEIQFDYVRFPEGFEKKADSLTFTKTDQSRVDAVAGFVKYAREQLEPLGVRVSVDIFGYAASVPAAEGIGQDFVKISSDVHVISPMIYPSHYGAGWFDQQDPDKSPYATIAGAMKDTHKKLDPIGDKKPIIRPWIQDFTASWLGKGHYIKYGPAEVEAQIKALHDAGVDEYLLWNAGNNYSEGVKY
ncbi:putative glycoside hydrolase [Paenibacillus sp. ATY16]|uniref:putative glycoside hydrolase n=1 Tax=Paenibacillus sp. ATY16 TaxID=1759312 RepID=UPI00200D0286|nr:putative glycoside hydrolase [Paenibacillus sp. ATY16]MCK9857136.1 putative glycoside hydrolase [Paenibacillus sp. ATY16]